ncbi:MULTISPECIES: hypothetical protein [unclassified Streptomyces]|uniref:hypothetical protein n=1 Tax=unclassified Streptomyces TaxID=2593676 RepID=UPI002DDB2A39|nr:hypothetical protein [Streptomyces sp. NBC_01445]WSE02306.1 hypothetical protein OG574_02225 [Streptomyces sp. NBC_01445]
MYRHDLETPAALAIDARLVPTDALSAETAFSVSLPARSLPRRVASASAVVLSAGGIGVLHLAADDDLVLGGPSRELMILPRVRRFFSATRPSPASSAWAMSSLVSGHCWRCCLEEVAGGDEVPAVQAWVGVLTVSLHRGPQ